MKSYWLYLETFVFLWYREDKGLLYNSISKKGYTFKNIGYVSNITKKLNDIQNMYAIELHEQTLENQEVNEFVKLLISTRSGNILSKDSCKEKPIIFPPKPIVMDDRKIHNNRKSVIRDVLKNIFEINIQLTGNCSNSCRSCDILYKQISHCHRNEFELSFDSIKLLFKQIEQHNNVNINFFGGNVLQYTNNQNLLNLMNLNKQHNYHIYIHYLHLSDGLPEILCSFKDVKIKVLFDAKYIDGFSFFCTKVKEHFQRLSFVFLVSGADDYNKTMDIIDTNRLSNIEILPIYKDPDSFAFFKESVFTNCDELITDAYLNRRQVMMQGVVNSNYFGALDILSNGEVFTDLSKPAVGSIYEESLHDIIYKELTVCRNWFNTRMKVSPCKSCLYKYLCPPPSKYENFLDSYKFCNNSSC